MALLDGLELTVCNEVALARLRRGEKQSGVKLCSPKRTALPAAGRLKAAPTREKN